MKIISRINRAENISKTVGIAGLGTAGNNRIGLLSYDSSLTVILTEPRTSLLIYISNQVSHLNNWFDKLKELVITLDVRPYHATFLGSLRYKINKQFYGAQSSITNYVCLLGINRNCFRLAIKDKTSKKYYQAISSKEIITSVIWSPTHPFTAYCIDNIHCKEIYLFYSN